MAPWPFLQGGTESSLMLLACVEVVAFMHSRDQVSREYHSNYRMSSNVGVKSTYRSSCPARRVLKRMLAFPICDLNL